MDKKPNEPEKSQKVKKPKTKTSLRDKILIWVFSLIMAASLLCVAGVYAMNATFFQEKEDPEIQEASRASGMATPQEIKHKSVNILVTGIDYTVKAGNRRGKLTDVILLVSFDMENRNVDVLQIPRDTYVGDASSTGKINALYSSKEGGGINGLMNKINQMFQIPIDHYVTINMDGFIYAVDAVGGVEVDVPKGFTLEGVTIQAGKQVLDGAHAEKFVRERHAYADADLGRIRMQQLFLEALLKKAFSLSLGQATSLASSLISQVTTDLTLNDILGYYQELMKVDLSEIHFHLLPVTGTMVNGQSVLSIKRYPTADLLNEDFRIFQSPVPAESLGIIELVKDYEYSSAASGNP